MAVGCGEATDVIVAVVLLALGGENRRLFKSATPRAASTSTTTATLSIGNSLRLGLRGGGVERRDCDGPRSGSERCRRGSTRHPASAPGSGGESMRGVRLVDARISSGGCGLRRDALGWSECFIAWFPFTVRVALWQRPYCCVYGVLLMNVTRQERLCSCLWNLYHSG